MNSEGPKAAVPDLLPPLGTVVRTEDSPGRQSSIITIIFKLMA